MSLKEGTRVGPYEIGALLGAGGMGEVYRARDTRLDRDAALKILPASFAGDPDRLARFEREAKTLASLNHPNIAAIYGLEQGPAGVDVASGFSRTIVLAMDTGPAPHNALSSSSRFAVRTLHSSSGVAKPMRADLSALPLCQTRTKSRMDESGREEKPRRRCCRHRRPGRRVV